MSQNIQSLWSPEIKAKVLSPLTILNGQAEALALQTRGVLLAQIASEELDGQRIRLSFDLVVPALNGSRHRILRVVQREDLPYPAFVEAEIFRHLGASSKPANTDFEFTQTIKEVLQSSQVLSLAQSLIARANEILATTAPVQ